MFDSAVGNEGFENGDDDVALVDIKIVKPYSDEQSAPDDGEKHLSESQVQERRRSRLRLGSARKAVKKAFDDGECENDFSDLISSVDSSIITCLKLKPVVIVNVR